MPRALPLILVILAIAVFGAGGTPGAHAEKQVQSAGPCRLALVLAVDVSPSVDGLEFQLQMEGTARAFQNPAIVNAIKSTPGGVAVTMTLWSNDVYQRQVIPWTLVTGDAAIAGFAAEISRVPWPRTVWGTGTGVGAAILHAAKLIHENPYSCKKRTIDVSGDGRNIIGPEPGPIRDQVARLGITINGLAVYSDEVNLVEYFRENVIGGPGAFVIGAASYDDFGRAIHKKLLRELQPRLAANRPGFDSGLPPMP